MAVVLWRVGVCEKFPLAPCAATSARSDEQMDLACG